MDSKEKAAMVFHFLANKRLSDAATVLESIERKPYHCTDPAYSAKLAGVLMFSLTWGCDYWRSIALQATDIAKYLSMKERGDEGRDENIGRLNRKWVTEMLARERALEVICQAQGIFPEDVRRFASNVPKFVPEGEFHAPDPECLESLVEGYTALINGFNGYSERFSDPAKAVH